MKTFTLSEANAILLDIEPKLRTIQRDYAYVAELRGSAQAAAVASQFGGGMEGGTSYVNTLYEIGKLTTEITDLGVEIKDYSRGLIDFPSLRAGRVVFLCWELSDGGPIEWWHETDAGFAGRQPL